MNKRDSDLKTIFLKFLWKIMSARAFDIFIVSANLLQPHYSFSENNFYDFFNVATRPHLESTNVRQIIAFIREDTLF